MLKIAVFGTGGVGGIFGSLLSRHGHEVHFIARGTHLSAIQSNGLKILSPLGDFQLSKVKATDRPEAIGPVDLILVCVKTWQLKEAREQIQPLVGSHSLILPLENGVEASEFLVERYPRAQVLRGLCAVISYIVSPGTIQHVGPPPLLSLGEFDNQNSARIHQLCRELSAPEIVIDVPKDIIAHQWRKFMMISSLGVISSLSQLPGGILKSIPESRNLFIRAMREVQKVGEALDVFLSEEAVQFGLSLFDGMPSSGTTSMQRDFAAGRRTELESFSGYVVRTAERLGVPVPIHQTCYHLLMPLELKAQGILQA